MLHLSAGRLSPRFMRLINVKGSPGHAPRYAQLILLMSGLPERRGRGQVTKSIIGHHLLWEYTQVPSLGFSLF